ncbi:DUF5134 domain-containing protein [Streptomyces armeniacus]|uniref:DUF5134 domain-containing protein n=1 Tax=Streptomyces armeniacus TaxID=83291 RepID=A0A345XK22_9ACTN|nr:DUF5134 domain-containing protein [Streptomyces armeniacus]AXK31988.1 DUF5134 domain-containing protein [Streptomyces armeniacus]
MHGPAVVSWLLVAVCGTTGAYCLTRIRSGSPARRRTSGLEAAMGLGMAAMALPAGVAAVPPLALTALFGAVTVWALCGLRTAGAHCLHHALEAAAMVYMALVMETAAGGGLHDGHSAAPGGLPALTGVLLAYFAVYALRTGTRVIPAAVAGAPVPPAGRGPEPGRPPGLADACGLALALGSFAMLLTL